MAYYNLEDSSNPILQIQRILRDLERLEGSISPIAPSGNFEIDTRDAVVRFQKKYGLSPTGVVDKETWDLLHKIDEAQRDSNQLINAIEIFPREKNYEIPLNTRDNVIYVIQHLLNEIKNEYEDFKELEFNGIYNKETQDNIKAFQRRHLIEDNGRLNAETINLLSKEYERINSRQG
ncbi:MAG: peptidoglycan-binding protein [Clostridia bacterium]|nr:peptidoglycan-binding protein [Clostridia bacterium]